VLFIGEAPGYHEDRQGRPFVGPAGQFLNELLGSVGLDRSTVFITNVVKHRPPENRDPLPDEIAACSDYLTRQIAALNPKVIVTLGRYSMARFFPGAKISAIHGQAKKVDGRVVVAMYHPAAALHQQSLRQTVVDDFKRSIPPALAEARRMEAKGKLGGTPKKKDNEDEPPKQLSLF
jgi:DNA polymerase